jgi:predicted secreted protein
MTQAGIDVVIKVDGVPVAGQQNAVLNRSMAPIDITNKINGRWKESLSGLCSWNLKCAGMYVVNSTSLQKLEDAFMGNEEIEVSCSFAGKNYFGRALITDFPVSSIYNAQFKYNLALLGVGELLEEND